MHPSRIVARSLAALGLAALGLGAASAQAASPQPSAYALSQIAALQAEKASRTPAQLKIDSNLLRAALPLSTAASTPKLSAKTLALLRTVGVRSDAKPDAAGLVLVDIKATVSSALLSRLAATGGTVIGSWPNYGAIRARLPLAQLEKIAADSAIRSIHPAAQAQTVRSQPATRGPLVPGLRFQTAPTDMVLPRVLAGEAAAMTRDAAAQRRSRVEAALPGLISRFQKTKAGRKAVLSLAEIKSGTDNYADPEGDYAHRAGLARQHFNVFGRGIKIGVLSDSVDGLADEQAKGALGPVTVLPGQGGNGEGEGTAMLEIVHRLAPGAKLYFATAFNGEASFAQNILDLKAAGCNIIVDDVEYFDEPAFSDGIIAQAAAQVAQGGGFYFSSAGNNFNLDQFGITATWEGDFVDSGVTFFGKPILAYDSLGDNINQVLTAASLPHQSVWLTWANPLGGATDDYDIYVLDSTLSTVKYFSTDPHTGTQDPIQASNADQGDYVLITKNHGNAVALHLFVTSNGAAALNLSTAAGTFGHNSAPGVYGTAAVDASINYANGQPFGPDDITENFSSDGPRRIFFHFDGTPITPGNLKISTNGGEVRLQPVLAAADGITDYFNPFYGTSAAAPHAAAIAGLVLSAKPSLSASQMRSVLINACIPIDTDFAGPAWNRDAGYGVLDAYAAVSQVKH